jgi:D-3-phosphoglycerate dehydrogenase
LPQEPVVACADLSAVSWQVLCTARGFERTPEAIALLEAADCTFVRTPYCGDRFDYELTGEPLVALLDGADAYIAGSALVSADVLAHAPKLKIVSRRGVGYERIDLEAARARGVTVTITTGANQHAVADHVFALLLAVARGIVAGHNGVVAGRWQATIGPELGGKTLGIVGLGRVGKGVARRARGFAMNVIASDPVRDERFAAEYGVAYVELDELLARADAISINASFNPTTRGLIDSSALARMKPGAIVINTARGGIVDEAALAQALHDGRLLGAGIDVFDHEPPVESPLLTAPNVVLAPHAGAYTDEAMIAANLLAAQLVVRKMRSEPLPEECVVA